MSRITNTSHSTWAFAIFRALEDYGVDGANIFRKHGIDMEQTANQSIQVTRTQLNSIWREAVAETKDDAFGLSISDYINDSALNALTTSTRACNTIKDAIDLASRYYKVISKGTRLISRINESLEIEISQALEAPHLTDQDIDVAFSLLIKYSATLTINKIKAIGVELTRATPHNIEKYKQAYDCPIKFGGHRNIIRFPKEVLNEPIPSANPALSTYVEKFLVDTVNDLNKQNIRDKAYAAIVSLLPTGRPKLADLAAKLNMSERTLQRKLRTEDICFKSLLDTIRLDLAKQYLQEQRYQINEISYLLGFSESSNFIRFFKNHVGKTPSEYSLDI